MTDDEIDKLCPETWSDWKTSARAIIAAHTEKLLAGAEMPEPFNKARKQQRNGSYIVYDSYTKDQLQAYAAAAALNARVKALEEAKQEAVKRHNAGEAGGVT